MRPLLSNFRLRKRLLKAYNKPRNLDRIYDTIVLMATKKKHSSGYQIIKAWGAYMLEGYSHIFYEYLGEHDDIEWKVSEYYDAPIYNVFNLLRTDAILKNTLQVWSEWCKFSVKNTYYCSFDIELVTKVPMK